MSLEQPPVDAPAVENAAVPSAAPAPLEAVALLVDNRERTSEGTRQQGYVQFFSRIEEHAAKLINCGIRCQGFFTKLLLADYLWANLTSGRLHLCLAVERKTCRDLVARSGKGDQLAQTQRLRAAGFRRVAVLFEGSPREARKEGNHMDKATITDELKLYEYMFEEQSRGVYFVEAANQERTALWLTAMSCVLCARSSWTCAPGDEAISWTSVVAKPAQEKVQLPREGGEGVAVLRTLAIQREKEVKDTFGDEAQDVLRSCATLKQVYAFVQAVRVRVCNNRPMALLLVTVRLGVSTAAASAMLDASVGCWDRAGLEPAAKRPRVKPLQAVVSKEGAEWMLSVDRTGAALFSIRVCRMVGSILVDLVRQCSGSGAANGAGSVQRAFDMAQNVAMMAGLRPDYQIADLDMGVLIIEGLDAAQRDALKRDATLGEPFEQALWLLMAALLAIGVSVKCCVNEQACNDYQQAVQSVLERRCRASQLAETVEPDGAAADSSGTATSRDFVFASPLRSQTLGERLEIELD
eukprot:NODE_3636_length_2007_cov_3.990957.p1 GENE.NODE_3636_length_2007_cov_3.990957~~NODE_3636_length_2007_cov_3.990957.p1  ORF type:complete len:524 (-),score=65.33 NODE_3636_length_2007_cov_3.990957:139-1710(-)